MTIDSAGVFEVLAQGGARQGNLRVRETDTLLHAGKVSHALDYEGRALLLVPLPADHSVLEDVHSKGVTARVLDGQSENASLRYLALRCEIPALLPTFSTLCDEVISALSASSQDPASVSLGVIERWRDLLGPSSNQLLSENKLLGLLCELQFLELLRDVTSPAAALAAWTGPDSDRQDFRSSTVAVEVKGCSLRDRIAVEMHGLRQLESPEPGKLFLWVNHVERATDDGDSVPDAVDRLSTSGVSRQAVLKRMQPVGYHASDENAYRSVRFSLIDRRAYRVDESFPKITAANLVDSALADRLLSVRYTVDLTDRKQFPRPLDFAIDAVMTLAAALK